MQKLFRVTEAAVITTAGTAELASQLMVEIQQKINEEGAIGVTRVMEITREVTRARYGEWFASFQIQQVAGALTPVRPTLQMIITGYDPDADGALTQPQVYQLAAEFDFAPMRSSHGFALQGVPQYALYLLNRLYAIGSSSGELKALAAYVITETASQDGKVGGPVQMAMVRVGGGCDILTEEQVDEVIGSNVERSEKLRASFFADGSKKRGH